VGRLWMPWTFQWWCAYDASWTYQLFIVFTVANFRFWLTEMGTWGRDAVLRVVGTIGGGCIGSMAWFGARPRWDWRAGQSQSVRQSADRCSEWC
jgi:hypothetical protein